MRAELRKEQQALILKARLGEIADTKDPKFRSERHKELLTKFDELTKREKELMVKDEFDRIYTTAGGSGMNAGTSNDFTVYFINVPANKLELWFWMESDRLAQSGLPRVLFGTRRGPRRAALAHRQHADRQI